MDPLLLGAGELAARLRRRELTAEALLEATLARYEAIDPIVHAVARSWVDDARTRARELDRAAARGEWQGPLHGVPMTVKESFDWAGVPTTHGDEQFAGNVATRNAVAVDRLLDAGAVIYGKTNIAWRLGDSQSFNQLYGTTRNPWDLDRTPGGSSGGSAVAVATGMAALELGSDIAGSLRNPAHYCGVFSHKSSFGLVPTEGHAVPGYRVPQDICVAGPIARTAADLALALDVLAPPATVEPGPPALAGLRVAVMLESPFLRQDSEVTRRLRATADAVAAAGAHVVDVTGPPIDHERSFEVFCLLLNAATGAYVPDDEHARRRDDVARYERGDRDYAALSARGASMTHREWLVLVDERDRYRERWAEFFAGHDVLLCPIAATPAFPHDHGGGRAGRVVQVDGAPQPSVLNLFWAQWTGGVYLPATMVPTPTGPGELPVGYQVVVPFGHDRRAIEFARLVEREVGGFVPPPLVAELAGDAR